MAWSDALTILERAAPTIATVAGTPLLGGAVAALEAVFGLTPAPDASMGDRQNAVATAVQGATPEQLAAVRKADQDYAARMAEAGFKDKEALAQLAVTEEQIYVGDTENARTANAANMRVFWMGVAVLVTFALVAFGALAGSYAVLTGKLPVTDAAVVGLVSGFIGTVIGYVASNATQVISFYYGSSKGVEHQSEAMSAAFTQVFAKGGAPAAKRAQ